MNLQVMPTWYRFTPNSTIIYPCPYTGNCGGGNTTGDDLCVDGARGPACALCNEEYYLDTNIDEDEGGPKVEV